MAQLFSGYARERGFKPISLPSARRRQDEQYVRSVQQARNLDNDNAVKIHKQLQEQFNIDQQTRQTFLDLETRAANLERTAKQQEFQYKLENAQAKQKDRIELLQTLANVSKTAGDILVKEKEKQNKAATELNQNLVLQYGLTAQEVQELQSMEGGLLDFEAEQSPLIQQLRQQGASESDISVLMKSSGWNAYGSALGVVQNAAENYDFYLTSKQNEDVTINGVSMSLAAAEAQGDVGAIAGIFDRHRMNYLKEYLPGYDAAFVAKYAREPMQQAESRRKRNMSTRMEQVAREGNYAKEKANLLAGIKKDLTNPQSYMDSIQLRAGRWDSPLIGAIHNRTHQQLVELAKDGLADRGYVEGIFNSTVKAKQFGGREVPFREAFPLKTKELKDALDAADADRRRVEINAIADEKRRGQQMADEIIREFTSNPSSMTLDNIQAAQRAVLGTGNIDAANRIAKLLPFSTEKTNDKEFDSYWSKQKALGNYPSSEDILFNGLSPNKVTAELQQRKEFEDTGLTKDVLKNIDKRIESLLRTQLGDAYGNTQKILPESYYAAFNAAKSQVMMDFRVAYKGPQSSVEAEQYAIGELKKEIAKENGQYKVNVIGESKDRRGKSKYRFDPGFSNFMGVAAVKKESPLPAIVDAHKNGVEAFRTELFTDASRVKQIVANLNNGTAKAFPSEYFAIQKSSGANMSDIIMSQIEVARKEDPSIPELKPEVKSIFQKQEQAINPNILGIIQRYSTPATVDRGLVQSNIPAIYDRSNPFVSFGQMIEATGKVRPDLIPTFLAVMAGESGFNPTIDTAQSGLDPFKRREFSIGLLQVNTKAHMDKLDRLGYTVDDLRNPVKNLEVAMLVYEEWIDVRMKNYGDTREEAEVNALDRWGAYRDGNYLPYLSGAVDAWTTYKQQSKLPVWQQSCNMTSRAKQWCANNPGRWN